MQELFVFQIREELCRLPPLKRQPCVATTIMLIQTTSRFKRHSMVTMKRADKAGRLVARQETWKTRLKPKSHHYAKERVSQPCLPMPLHVPLTLPTCGAAFMGPQCATRSMPATVKSTTGREMFLGSPEGSQERPSLVRWPSYFRLLPKVQLNMRQLQRCFTSPRHCC